MKKSILILLIFTFFILSANAKHLHKEAEYQEAWCKKHNGIMEFELPDKTRVDCIATIDNEKYAIEFDFCKGSKIYECVGQSLYYSIITGYRAGAVLILENSSDKFYLNRFKKIAKKYNIRYWTMSINDLKK